MTVGKLGLATAGATAVVALVAGCGSSSNSVKSSSSGGSTAPQTSGSANSSLQSKPTSIGTVLVDSSGRTVYELVGDTAANSKCTGSCLAIWPPVKVNGTQVVVNGHPAYTFAADSGPGQTKGQNVTDQWGQWLALDSSGNPIAAAANGPASTAPTSKAPNGGGAAF